MLRGGAGASATALIIAAFTGRDPDRWPADTADLERCERAYEAAPLHLRMFMAPWLQKFHAHVHRKGKSA